MPLYLPLVTFNRQQCRGLVQFQISVVIVTSNLTFTKILNLFPILNFKSKVFLTCEFFLFWESKWRSQVTLKDFKTGTIFTSTSKHSNVDEVNPELLNLNKQNWSQVLDVILDFEMPLWIVQVVSVQFFFIHITLNDAECRQKQITTIDTKSSKTLDATFYLFSLCFMKHIFDTYTNTSLNTVNNFVNGHLRNEKII